MKKIITSIVLFFFFASGGLAFTQPQQQLDQMIQSVLEILRSEELSSDQKKAQVSSHVQQTLNLESMAQRTLGASWADASKEEQQKFTQLFIKLLESTYLNQISDFSDGKVIYLNQRVKGDKAIVDTKIVSDGIDVPVRYKMFLEGDRWQVFDVVIEGVSLIRNYRSSYGEIIRREGYQGLFALMEKKIVTMNRN